ncbi:M23 family metallopeptidase [Bacillus sp. WMMC1349]|uniref:M23 family metallopeptidase n=1 Tax=Bacillus sp. WMMC1349 TaxID=2736254 RepID=UPI001555E7C4|nr:M23 family metallopeptidase [Bacillus sp. WMMC1349]NPC94707.1 M23 family metallopeptidase [Bacillus sp. WMMC1349]
MFRSKHISIVFAVVLMLLWGTVLCYGREAGPYAWWGLMVFGIAGVVSFTICFIVILIRIYKKRSIGKHICILLMISLVSAWPGGWFLGIGQIAYPADPHSVKPAVSIRSPFHQPAIIAWGGDTLKDNYHVWLPAERWAYDIFAKPAVIDSPRLDDYGIYGAEIVAPISGTIVGAYDREKDIAPGADQFKSMLGNYLFIRIEKTGTYLVFAHLKRDSVKVRVGDVVKEGTPIARAGNSGMSSEPHLHIHHQRQNPNQVLLLAEGLPLFFRDINGPSMPKGGGDRLEKGVRIPNGQQISPR